MEKLTTSGRRIIEAESGGEVILHGLNLVCKKPEKGFPPCPRKDLAWMAGQGFNLLRLGVNWAAAEPEPGVYNRNYLTALRALADEAGELGLTVFLDMHQDLYGQRFADGAPDWATLTDGLSHQPGAVWSDAYLQSPAVIRALDHFWQNSSAPDGTGLQDHLAALWRQVAAVFQGSKNLLGFDLLNEPFPGSVGQKVLGAMVAAAAGEDPAAQAALLAALDDREQLLALLEDDGLFERLLRAGAVPAGQWEEKVLSPFYEKLAAGLDGVMLLESSYFSNMGVESGLQKPSFPAIYAPHIYDLVVDTGLNGYSSHRLETIFAAHRRVQERLDLPVLVGEWGAFYRQDSTARIARQTGALLARYGWSDAYWSWEPDLPSAPCLPGLLWGYPQRVGGRLCSYSWEEGVFRMTYQSDGSPCRIWLPGRGLVERCCPPGLAEIRVE